MDDRGDFETVIGGADAKDPLGDGDVVPGGSAGQPGVLGFAVGRRVAAGDHLGVDVRLATVQIAELFARGGISGLLHHGERRRDP